MSEFSIYLTLGAEHITDPRGYDHILFIIALAATYMLKDWRPVAVLVTAFTIGHSITLVMATLDLVQVSSEWIEFLIPLTIFLTCVFNYFQTFDENKKPSSLNRYLIALSFGLIHGLGFSNFLRGLLGKETSIIEPLLAFNIGLELGQLAIVFGTLTVTSVFVTLLRVKRREWMLLLTGAAGGMSIIMMLERLPF